MAHDQNYATVAVSSRYIGGLGGSTLAQGSEINEVANPNFASSVNYADERVSILVERIEHLANKLCGTRPPETEGKAARSVANGLLDDVMDRAGDIVARAEIGLAMIGRIERALP